MTFDSATYAAAPAGCERCGRPLPPGALACPNCRALVYRDRLEAIAAEATRLEAFDPVLAAQAWRRALDLLPTDAQQYHMVAQRIAALSAGAFGGDGPGPASYPPPPTGQYPAPYPGGPAGAYAPAADEADAAGPSETWQSVLLKTGGSMALSIYLFSQMAGGWEFAVGLVLLIFVHEMGHVVANWYYGIRQSAPIFLGIFGAVIFVKGRIRGAWEEAVMGIAGPVFGTVAALACYAWFLATGEPLAAVLAFYGLFLNAFNLLPVPPLDGGRTAAAITPWLWPAGLVGIGAVILTNLADTYRTGGRFNVFGLLIMLWILSQTWPRVVGTLRGGAWRAEYYRVGAGRRAAMVAVYVGLAAVLLGCLWHLNRMTGLSLF